MKTNPPEICGAQTRNRGVCNEPALENRRCAIHGGLSPGAPEGPLNGSFKHGFCTKQELNKQRAIKRLLKAAAQVKE